LKGAGKAMLVISRQPKPRQAFATLFYFNWIFKGILLFVLLLPKKIVITFYVVIQI
jgi:hypothetical protein